MKKLFILLFAIMNFHYSFAQNPENGAFWSFEMCEETLNVPKWKYEGMGFSETASGQYAFVFEKDKVTVYYDGFLGQGYKRNKVFPITSRNVMSEEKDWTEYGYFYELNNEIKYAFTIRVSNNDYNIAVIEQLEEFIKNVAHKKTTFKVTRKFLQKNF